MNAFSIALIVAAGVFVLVLTLLSFLFREKRHMQNRIDKITDLHKVDLLAQIKQKRKRNGVDDSKIKMLKKLENDLSMSGILMRPSEFLMIWVVMAFVPSILLLLISHNLILALIALPDRCFYSNFLCA